MFKQNVRTKFAKYIKKYGYRLQYSVFEITNSKNVLKNIIEKNINLVRLLYIVPIIMYIDTGIKVYSLLGKEQKVGRKENLIKAKEIYKNTMQDIISDKNKWKEFIEFSSKFYKYSFTENLLMFGQKCNNVCYIR